MSQGVGRSDLGVLKPCLSAPRPMQRHANSFNSFCADVSVFSLVLWTVLSCALVTAQVARVRRAECCSLYTDWKLAKVRQMQVWLAGFICILRDALNMGLYKCITDARCWGTWLPALQMLVTGPLTPEVEQLYVGNTSFN